MTDWLHCATML